SAIMPLLNGMAHLDALAARFGKGAVLGGVCAISSTLDPEGRILHLNDVHLISSGETDGALSARSKAITAAFSGAGFDFRLSQSIRGEVGEEWVLISTMAGINCLRRARVGDIIAAGAGNLTTALLDECAAIAAASGFEPSEPAMARNRATLTAPGSTFAAS